MKNLTLLLMLAILCACKENNEKFTTYATTPCNDAREMANGVKICDCPKDNKDLIIVNNRCVNKNDYMPYYMVLNNDSGFFLSDTLVFLFEKRSTKEGNRLLHFFRFGFKDYTTISGFPNVDEPIFAKADFYVDSTNNKLVYDDEENFFVSNYLFSEKGLNIYKPKDGTILSFVPYLERTDTSIKGFMTTRNHRDRQNSVTDTLQLEFKRF